MRGRQKSEDEVARYAKVKMKLMGAPDWKKVALSMQPAAARKSQSKKRTSTDGSEAATASGSNSKRARRGPSPLR